MAALVGSQWPIALDRVVHPPTIQGVLRSLAAAFATAPTAQASGPAAAAAGRQQLLTRAAAATADLSSVQRRQLRAFLLQKKWFDSEISGDLIGVLTALPIYEVHTNLEAWSDSTESTASRAGGGGSFVALDVGMHVLAPRGVDPLVLRRAGVFLSPEGACEESVMEQGLGVRRIGVKELLSAHLVPDASHMDQAALSNQMALVLRALPGLCGRESGLEEGLR
jgi:hypothetical protein